MKTILLLFITSFFFLGCSKYTDEKKMNQIGQLFAKGDLEAAENIISKELEQDPLNKNFRLAKASLLFATLQQNAQYGLENSDSLFSVTIQYMFHEVHQDSSLKKQIKWVWREWCQNTLEKKDTIRTIQRLKMYATQWPNDSYPIFRKAPLEYQIGLKEEAKQSFSRGIELDSVNAIGRFNYGMMYYMEGDNKKAMELWLDALELDPKNKDIIDWIGILRKELFKTKK